MDTKSRILYNRIDSLSYLERYGNIGEEHDIIRVSSIHPLFFPAESCGNHIVESIIGDHIGDDGTRWRSLRKSSFVARKSHNECHHFFQIIFINHFTMILQEGSECFQKRFFSPFGENRGKKIRYIDLIYSRYGSRFLRVSCPTCRCFPQNSLRPIGIFFIPK